MANKYCKLCRKQIIVPDPKYATLAEKNKNYEYCKSCYENPADTKRKTIKNKQFIKHEETVSAFDYCERCGIPMLIKNYADEIKTDTKLCNTCFGKKTTMNTKLAESRLISSDIEEFRRQSFRDEIIRYVNIIKRAISDPSLSDRLFVVFCMVIVIYVIVNPAILTEERFFFRGLSVLLVALGVAILSLLGNVFNN